MDPLRIAAAVIWLFMAGFAGLRKPPADLSRFEIRLLRIVGVGVGLLTLVGAVMWTLPNVSFAQPLAYSGVEAFFGQMLLEAFITLRQAYRKTRSKA